MVDSANYTDFSMIRRTPKNLPRDKKAKERGYFEDGAGGESGAYSGVCEHLTDKADAKRASLFRFFAPFGGDAHKELIVYAGHGT